MAKLPKLPPNFINIVTGALGAIGGLGVLGYTGMNSLYNVKGGERAIIFNRIVGVRPDVIAEGSRDLQMVELSLRVLTRPEVSKLPYIFQTLGTDYDEKVLPSIVNEVLKQVIAQFTAPQLLTQREAVSQKIRQNLQKRARDFNIVLEDVSITELHFGREFTAAVEAKQVAQQEAERARFVVEKALQDKRSTIIRAQGEARAAELIGEAIKENPGFVKLKRIDTAKQIAGTMLQSRNQVFLSSEALLLNLLGDAGLGGKDGRQ